MRAGVRVALITGLPSFGLALAEMAGYYRGHGTPDVGARDRPDALSSEAVRMVPQVSPVTIATEFQDSTIVSRAASVFAQAPGAAVIPEDGYAILVESYGYPIPAMSLVGVPANEDATRPPDTTIILGSAYTAPTAVDIANASVGASLPGVFSYYATLDYRTPGAPGTGGYSRLLVNIVPARLYATEWGLVAAGLTPVYTPLGAPVFRQ
jgi:hypothetical protein